MVPDAENVLQQWSNYAESGCGDEWLKKGGVYLEYGGDTCSAQLREDEFPYTGWAGFFLNANTPEEYGQLAELAVRQRMRINTYVGGDIKAPLQALEGIAQRLPLKDLRIVFFYLVYATDDQIRRMGKLNIHATCAPFNHLCKRAVNLLEGPGPVEKVLPLRSLDNSNIPAAFSTDNLPINPMLTLWAAEARRDETTGRVLGTRERLGRRELLKGFTRHGATLSFDEARRGSLEVGKLADLIVLSDDPMEVPTEALREVKVLMTMVDGKIVYRNPGAIDF